MLVSMLAIDLLTFLNRPTVIIGLSVAILGFSLVILAKRLARVFRRTDDIADDDAICRNIRIVGIIIILSAFIMIVIPS